MRLWEEKIYTSRGESHLELGPFCNHCYLVYGLEHKFILTIKDLYKIFCLLTKKARKQKCAEMMNKALDYFVEQLKSIRYGVPTAALIDTVRVNYNGQLVQIRHIATTKPYPDKIIITPYDSLSIGWITEGLKQSGFNSYVYSKTQVAVSLPKYATSADRDKVLTQVRKLEEETKISIRNARKKIRQGMKFSSKEEEKKAEKELQEITDKYISQVKLISDNKIKELSM